MERIENGAQVVLTNTHTVLGVTEARKGTKGIVVDYYETLNSRNTKTEYRYKILATISGKEKLLEAVNPKIVSCVEQEGGRIDIKKKNTEDLLEHIIDLVTRREQTGLMTKKHAELGKKIEKAKQELLSRIPQTSK